MRSYQQGDIEGHKAIQPSGNTYGNAVPVFFVHHGENVSSHDGKQQQQSIPYGSQGCFQPAVIVQAVHVYQQMIGPDVDKAGGNYTVPFTASDAVGYQGTGLDGRPYAIFTYIDV